METLLVSVESKSELKFLSEMLKKMRIKSQKLSITEKEDLFLAHAIEKGMKTKNISKIDILKTLNK
jgi:hypothetical protein